MHPRRLTEPAPRRISSSDAVESRSLLQADADECPQGQNFVSPNSAEGHDTAHSARHLPASDLTFRSLLAGGIVGVRCLSPSPHAAYRLTHQQAFVVAMNINFGLKVGWTQVSFTLYPPVSVLAA